MTPRGFRRSPLDGRDRDFADIEPRLRAAGRRASGQGVWLDERTPISDQGALGSCVANATCDAVEHVMPHPTQLSRLFVYWNARRSHGEECVDEGTHCRAAFASLSKLGAPPESVWPYDPAHVLERPSLFAYEQAYDHKIHAYYAIRAYGEARLDAIESALRGGLPVVFGTDVGDELDATDGKTPLRPPRRVTGGHAMMISGVEWWGSRRVWTVRNSWGRSFGARGYCLFADEYLTDLATSDLWVPVFAPDFLEVAP